MAGSAHPGNPVNNVSAKVGKHYSSFPLKFVHVTTERFGVIDVAFATDVLRGDNLRLSLPHKLRSYTLKSPFFGAIRKNHDFLFVAKDAILPINADKVNVQPTQGDDIPDGVNCSIKNAPEKIFNLVHSLYVDARNFQPADQDEELDRFVLWLRFLIIGSYFYSPGSLLAKCGYNLSKQWRFSKNARNEDVYARLNIRGTRSFDSVFDDIIETWAADSSATFSFSLDGQSSRTFTVDEYTTGEERRLTIRLLIEALLDEPALLWNSSKGPFTQGVFATQSIDAVLLRYSAGGEWQYVVHPQFQTGEDAPESDVLNFGRLAAYQIACHHFMSNDKVDYIFSAELYRELMGSYVKQAIDTGDFDSGDYYFNFNGISTRFDNLSGWVLDQWLNITGDDTYTSFKVSYLAGLFSFRRSLRYVDYYVGAKTQPLAVGDPYAPVSGQGVSIIELSRKTALTKLAFATNQLGSKAKKWLEGIFPGRSIEWDKHDPAFIGHSASMVVGDETENTGNAQFEDVAGIDTTKNSTTSVFRGRPGKEFAFSYSAALPGYIVGVSYYDIPRVYSDYRDRQMMAYDRHDEFNPMLQYTGDQPIYLAEIDPTVHQGEIFGYQTKDMQYKQMVNRATGGFSEGQLPSWYFDDASLLEDIWHSGVQGPSKIRSHSSELDKFYLSLTGWSQSTYFHFILEYDCDFSGKRPMSFRPQLSL